MKIKNRGCASAAGFILFVSVVLASFLPSFAAEGELKQAEITGIEILDNTIRIKADAPITYKIYRPDDPFRITVDIERARLGKFTNKIFPDRAGITEIEPVQILKPATVARFNVLLRSPATITPEVSDTTLSLSIKSDVKAAGAESAPGKPGDSEETSAPAEEIVELLFKKTDSGAQLVLKGDGEMPHPRLIELEGRIILEIPDILISTPLPPTVEAPVKDIGYKYENNNLRVTVDLTEGAKASVDVLDDELVVSITSKIFAGVKGNEKNPRKTAPPMVSFDVQDADIVTIMRLLSDVSGYNIVVHPDVKGKITMKLLNVPWDQALDIILKTFNLDKVIEGNVIRIATVKTFQEEHKAFVETQELFGKSENIETKVFVVNYANVDKVKDAIDKAKILTSRGNISTDPRTRSIIVKDIAVSMEEIRKLITTLDKPTRQVLIEARIVDVSKNYSSELGVQWNGFWTPKGNNPAVNALGSTSAGTTGVNGSRVFTTVPAGTPAAPTTFFPNLVNLGTNSAPTGAFTLGLLNASQTLGLDLRISALESNGTGKIISNPKIMTVDNEKAVIKQGQRIPYSTVSQFGTQVQFIDASLDLIVTPQVGPDKSILLNIEAHNNQPNFSQTSQGLPTINTNEATTQVLIRDGETVVIGGVLKTNDQESEDSIPGISRIPILGALFRHTARTLSTSEQLIFITPRVIEQ
ncbi:MAG: type IV pilus secretin PilQ [Nitrospirae bacterium]|nr:type IV pilus secretin PilQ [Nitrospirota bacterium]